MATDFVFIEMCGKRIYQAMLEPLLQLTQKIVLVVKPVRTFIHDITMYFFCGQRGLLRTTVIWH